MRTAIVRFNRPVAALHPGYRALRHIEGELNSQRIAYSGWVTDGGERAVLVLPEDFFERNRSIFDALEGVEVELEVSSGKRVP